MQTSSQTALKASTSDGAVQSRGTEDLIYQAITVIAVLVLLGGLWAF